MSTADGAKVGGGAPPAQPDAAGGRHHSYIRWVTAPPPRGAQRSTEAQRVPPYYPAVPPAPGAHGGFGTCAAVGTLAARLRHAVCCAALQWGAVRVVLVVAAVGR